MPLQIAPVSDIMNLMLAWTNTSLHWKTHERGYAEMRVQAHRKAKWVSIDSAEHAEKSSKRTMLTLSEEQAKQLRDFLNEVLA